jgi:hypothetical protein
MITNYATETLSAAIHTHLTNLEDVPPTKESVRLATEITEVVWTELSEAGLSREAVEKLFAKNTKTRAQGRV